MSASSVCLLPRPRMRDIISDRLALVKTSGMTKTLSNKLTLQTGCPGWLARNAQVHESPKIDVIFDMLDTWKNATGKMC